MAHARASAALALYSPPMWKTIGLLSALCLAFIGLLIGLSLGGA